GHGSEPTLRSNESECHLDSRTRHQKLLSLEITYTISKRVPKLLVFFNTVIEVFVKLSKANLVNNYETSVTLVVEADSATIDIWLRIAT
ncbi:hypothetical protein N9Z88_03895, partial [Akkermansiaceae bacterium]|nr:hypothetical protein [Akkermansiaceae bacterium]